MPAWMWDPQIQYFAGHYHVVALDPRSQGDSDKPLEGNSPERRAQDIKELVDHLKLAPVVLVGWPLAAPELLSYAEQFGGGQVRTYVLVDGFAGDKLDAHCVTAMPGMFFRSGERHAGPSPARRAMRIAVCFKAMHELNYFREHLEVFAEMAKKRGAALDLEAFRKLDKERRELITATEHEKAQRNRASEEIARLKKEKQNADALIAEMKQVSERIKQSDERIASLDSIQRDLLLTIPNLPHSSVPVGTGAADNVEVRRWGTPPKFDFQPKAHWEVGEGAGILDLGAATKMTGARFAVYKGWGARLERALANFFLDVHTREHGYTEILPPFLVNTASLTGAGQLPKFAADLFKVQDTDFWLTPTSEVELHNLYRDETIPEEKLPIHVAAWTACFRSEAGAAGKDTRGILRQHQFQKVELFKFTHPEKSYEEHEAIVQNAETILQKLGLHYRTMLLSTGDLGFASSKTYDLEVWLPSSNEFREISSCSNCEAFQARRAGIRFKPKGGGKSDFVHTLNGSGLAVGRTWIAVVENYQQADGSIWLPEVLRPYMGIERIPGAR
jgi:seryl-tRNA synthetase